MGDAVVPGNQPSRTVGPSREAHVAKDERRLVSVLFAQLLASRYATRVTTPRR